MKKLNLLSHIKAILAEMDRRYQERFEAQTKALDAAFLAQQTAMQAALLAAEKAVQTALSAAEKAVAKAETAAEKRFDAVNEFRGAYQDIISLQMPRAEAEQRLNQLSDKIDELKRDNSLRVGHSTGVSDGWKILIGVVGILASGAVILNFLR